MYEEQRPEMPVLVLVPGIKTQEDFDDHGHVISTGPKLLMEHFGTAV